MPRALLRLLGCPSVAAVPGAIGMSWEDLGVTSAETHEGIKDICQDTARWLSGVRYPLAGWL